MYYNPINQIQYTNMNQNFNNPNQQQNNNFIQIKQNQFNNVIQTQYNQITNTNQIYYPIIYQNPHQNQIMNNIQINNSNNHYNNNYNNNNIRIDNNNNYFNNNIKLNNNNNNLIINKNIINTQNSIQNNQTKQNYNNQFVANNIHNNNQIPIKNIRNNNQSILNNNINEQNKDISIIKKEVNSGHANAIPENISDKLYNSIVKIKLSQKSYGTGFFMKFNINEKEMKCLITCQHVISQKDINNKIKIELYYGKKNIEDHKQIKLDEDIRFIRVFNKDVTLIEIKKDKSKIPYKEDVTLIEIIENDNISKDKYLDIDLNYQQGYEQYINNNFYLAGYPKNYDDRCLSTGRIIKISDFAFYHTLDTDVGSSGSPICNQYCKVIGIHTSGNEEENINYGIFIGKIIDNLRKSSNKNYIIAELYINDEDINKDIRIINSFEQAKREHTYWEDDYKNKNEKEIKENCIIKVNGMIFQFSYFLKFKNSGKYIIEYYFKHYITNTNYMFYDCSSLKNLRVIDVHHQEK